jgi:hypothetical protein
VIDVSGDGPSNAGPDIVTAREAALAAGATINGLPITLPANGETGEHFGRNWLRRYYETCVSGGPGAFVLPVDDPSALHISILRKLVLEIALGEERLVYAREDRHAAFDRHLIGQTPGSKVGQPGIDLLQASACRRSILPKGFLTFDTCHWPRAVFSSPAGSARLQWRAA